MPSTIKPTFDSLDSSALTDITGGCGNKRRCRCPRPAPQPAPGPRSSVDVSVNYGAQSAQARV